MRNLEAHGVDGDDLALVGEAAHTEASTERHTTDRRILSSVSAALAVGVVAGALVGGIIGSAVMGIVALLWPDVIDSAWVVVLMVCWFAAGGAVLCSIAAIARAIGFSESMTLTWEDDPDAPIWLAVYGDDEQLRSEVEATRPLQIVDDPEVTAHPGEVSHHAPPSPD
jgi:hypothetical protein